MAEGTTLDTKRVVCPFYLKSICRFGARCSYSHDVPSNVPESDVCYNYLKGLCVYGNKCRFSHPTENSNPENITENSYPIFKSLNDENVAEFSSQYSVPVSRSDVDSNSSCSSKLNTDLCTHFFEGDCPDDECPRVHGEFCELCRKYCLHPIDEEQRNQHIVSCCKRLEFSIQRNSDKTCGICFEVILKKDSLAERRFGILEKCNHVFCVSCIRKWRNVRDSRRDIDGVDPAVARACPQCRESSDFFIPSDIWVDTEQEKEKLIADYKKDLSTRPCKYFRKGNGICPFDDQCFHLHAFPDGTRVPFNVVNVQQQASSRRRRRRVREAVEENSSDIVEFLESVSAAISVLTS